MIDFNKEIVKALGKILPVHYELALTTRTPTPCISYQERNNYMIETGDNLGYSRVSYTIKVWDNDISAIQRACLSIDAEMRKLGFIRTSVSELSTDTLISKILTYEGLGLENY